jgi:hypothetical protein
VRFLLHLAVADVVNDVHSNEFWMSQSRLADKVGCARTTVNEWLGEALELGALAIVRDNAATGRPNVYRFEFAEGEGVRVADTGCPSGGQEGVRVADTKQETQLKRTQTSNAAAEQVVAAWCDATGRNPERVRVNAKRLAAVKARLAEGYTTADLVAAARGIGVSAWHMGENPDGKRYDDLLVAIRDGERVERFRDLYESGGDKSTSAGSAVDEALRLLGDQ